MKLVVMMTVVMVIVTNEIGVTTYCMARLVIRFRFELCARSNTAEAMINLLFLFNVFISSLYSCALSVCLAYAVSSANCFTPVNAAIRAKTMFLSVSCGLASSSSSVLDDNTSCAILDANEANHFDLKTPR